jgi:hypothetical protein
MAPNSSADLHKFIAAAPEVSSGITWGPSGTPARDQPMRVNRDSLAAILATAAFLIVVSLGFWKTHGPSTQRLVRADEKRIQNVSQLANEIDNDYRHHDKQLPERLSDSQNTKYADPFTAKPPEYTAKPPSGFSLCTTFATASPKEELKGNLEIWIHPAGPKCFEFKVGEPVPPAPYFYYY